VLPLEHLKKHLLLGHRAILGCIENIRFV